MRPSKAVLALAALLTAGVLSACDDGPHSPSESYRYNAFLYFGEGFRQQLYLGKVRGISACQIAAHNEAKRRRLSPRAYDYICCWESDGSSCREKHK